MSGTTTFLIVNILGGAAVLGGYVICLYMFPDQREALWGGVQPEWRPLFIVSMFIAAVGYLAFSYGILLKSSTAGFSFAFLNATHGISILCLVFLVSAATWMPSTIAYLKTSNSFWLVISITSLWVTAISLLTVTTMMIFSPHLISSTFYRSIAIVGISCITLHCLVLDAIIWVSQFLTELRN